MPPFPVTFEFLFGGLFGYFLSKKISYPAGKPARLPRVRIGNIQFLPNFRIITKRRHYHIHHWITLPLYYAPMLYFFDSIRSMYLLHAIVIGSIIHGLRFPDRFQFIVEEVTQTPH